MSDSLNIDGIVFFIWESTKIFSNKKCGDELFYDQLHFLNKFFNKNINYNNQFKNIMNIIQKI